MASWDDKLLLRLQQLWKNVQDVFLLESSKHSKLLSLWLLLKVGFLQVCAAGPMRPCWSHDIATLVTMILLFLCILHFCSLGFLVELTLHTEPLLALCYEVVDILPPVVVYIGYSPQGSAPRQFVP